MKKLFLILAILCLGVMPMMIAETQTQTQPVSVTVAEITKLTISPASLDFGSVRPTIPGKGQDVTFDSTESNVDVTVSSSVEEGSVFENIGFILSDNSIKNIKEFSIALPISSQQGIVGTQISLPTGLVPGVRTGIITYTITSTFCGDNLKNGLETCDGSDLAGKTCNDLVSGTTGILTCKTDCSGFVTTLCVCAPETDSAFCLRVGKTCGDVTANDNCGTSRTVNCGTCAEGTCTEGVCVAG